MNTILKAIASLVAAAFVPIVQSGCLFALFLTLVTLFPIAEGAPVSGLGFDLAYVGALAMLLMMASVMLLLGFLVSLMYTFLFALPALLIGWYFRAIRWWTTLFIAFLIGIIPPTLPMLTSPIGHPAGTPVWQSTDPADLMWVVSSAPLFGVMGLTSGLVFWLLWRFWVMPHSPAGRPAHFTA